MFSLFVQNSSLLSVVLPINALLTDRKYMCRKPGCSARLSRGAPERTLTSDLPLRRAELTLFWRVLYPPVLNTSRVLRNFRKNGVTQGFSLVLFITFKIRFKCMAPHTWCHTWFFSQNNCQIGLVISIRSSKISTIGLVPCRKKFW